MLRKLSYWAPLDAGDKAALLGLPHRVKTLANQAYIVREGDRPSHSCLMLTGYSFRQKVGGDGARQILAVHMAGDLVDLQNSLLGTADHSVQTLVPSEVAFISREAIQQIAFERPRIGFALWYDTLVDASVVREWLLNVGRRSARAALAHLLCEFSLRLKVAGLGDPSRYELPMTQHHLADALGLTPVHVNRTIRQFELEGLIGRTARRTINVSDWSKLADIGDFDSTYLRLKDDEPALA
jgi:CRP-like cAMP-binding protein